MKKRLLIACVAALSLVLSMTLPAAAVEFSSSDLTGTWSWFAVSHYEVSSTQSYGWFVSDNGGLSGGGGGFLEIPIQSHRGALSIAGSGEVTGNIAGLASGVAFQYPILLGRMNQSKDTIIASGTDQNGWMAIIIAVKAN